MISCIITTYKREVPILKRAVDSIVNQTYKDIEIIVVNDAPDQADLREEIKLMLQDYNFDIKYIVHDVNKGACAARNTGISASAGEYIAFLDDDDEWIENKLEIQLQEIEKDNSALVYGDYVFIDAQGEEHIKKPSFKYLTGKNDFEKLLCFNYIGSTSFPLIRTSALKSAGGFNINLKSSQDHEMWLKIAENNKISYIEKPLVRYYYSEVSITRSISNREQGYSYLLEEFRDAYRSCPDVLHCRYILLSITYFGMKRFRQGFYYWRKAFALKPFCPRNFSVIKRVFEKILS
ncbi:MAG: glycosyltransferase [Porcipelethomonas sp.]